ncbi:MAG: GYD domain-containing protein [Planctomycetes bacterium]|nr:GYD domain-containing protein [Planctomycetota bacterium]
MTRYVVLLNFTEKGIGGIKDSVQRSAAFRASAEKAGATVESLFWTLGSHDGVIVLSAPDDATAAAVVLELGRGNAVRTTMLRAFDAEEFSGVVAKIS